MKKAVYLFAMLLLSALSQQSFASENVEIIEEGTSIISPYESGEKTDIIKNDITQDTNQADTKEEPPISECLKEENSCPVWFLQDFVCAIADYNCISDGDKTLYSWGLVNSYNWDIFSEFERPSNDEISQRGDTLREQRDIIDHDAIEFLICKKLGPDHCVDESIYKKDHEKTCKEFPDMCSGNGGNNTNGSSNDSAPGGN